MTNKLIDKGTLARQDFAPGRCSIEIGHSVDLRKALPFSRTWRPFHFELVGTKCAEVEVGLHCKRMDHFSALLAQGRESDERAGRRKTGLLREFTFCAS